MEPSKEYTGPPIGDPPEHVHDNEPVVDSIEDTQDEVDELVSEIRSLETVSQTRHTELLERITTCQTQLEALSNRSMEAERESPMLTQMLGQLTQIQSELLEAKNELKSLKESTAMRQPNREPNELITEIPMESDSLNQDSPIDVVDHVENPTPEKPKNRRWV